jgi:drug/metabolite transporter (DMT)-like permease
VVIVFLLSFILAKPVSDGGRLARKLCIANAVGWLFILPLSSTGHPPPWLIPMVLFWLLNLGLVPAAVFALWASYKEREERIPYLAVASSYIMVNLAVLFVIPIVWLMREVRG